MNLFYVPHGNIELPYLTLTGQEANHASKVLRYRAGDQIHATDGSGTLFTAEVEALSRDSVVLRVIDTQTEEQETPRISLCVGLIKKRDRLEFAVEKAVELGVNEIILFRGRHSQKEKVRTDRLEATALSAMKQSLRYYLPAIHIESSLVEVIDKHGEESDIIMADETTDSTALHNLSAQKQLLIVGPEGGFSKEERELLKKRHGIPYSLGKKRLRTETAAIVMTERFRNQRSI